MKFCYRQSASLFFYICRMEIVLKENHFILSHHKTIFWKEKKSLLLADLHLTKETHFRKHGIAVPAGITTATLQKLETVIHEFSPTDIIFLGDLFHSDINKGVDEFADWKNNFPDCHFKLVEGNHDVLKTKVYDDLQIELCDGVCIMGDFALTHEPNLFENKINFCGHVHPCITLHGKAKQSLRLPCFYFNHKNFILPAFGNFTGSHSVQVNNGDKVYAVAEEKIVEVK